MSALYWALRQIAKQPNAPARAPASRTAPVPNRKQKPQVSGRGGGFSDYQPKER